MPAIPNISSQMEDDIDEVFTFPIKYDRFGFDRRNSTVLVNYHEDSTATIILNDPPGRLGYHHNQSEIENDPVRQAQRDLAHDLVEYAEELFAEYDPQTSSWTANSGNRNLLDIYVKVDKHEVNAVMINMWELVKEFKERYVEYLTKHEPEELVSPSNSLENKITEIKRRQHLSY